jgi:hypothetical protein
VLAIYFLESYLWSDNHTFVIRIWREGINREKQNPIWRGSIYHVATDERIYFDDVEKVVAFIQTKIGNNVRNTSRKTTIIKVVIRTLNHIFRRHR